MSSQIQFRKQMRDRKRKQLAKRRMFLFVLLIIIITVIILSVKGISSFLKQKSQNEQEFIFNGYVYPMPPEKNADTMLNLNSTDGIKTAYLTFDDGPNTSNTALILDTLRKYDAKATFFCVGTLMEKNPDMSRRIYEEGHLLANHSYSHNYSELYDTEDSFMNEINKTEKIIDNIVQRSDYPKFFRFPGGGYNAGSYGEKKQLYKANLEGLGYYYCDWNALNGDAEYTSPDFDYLLSRVKTTVKGKEDVIILMHDSPVKAVTAKTLGYILDYLIGEGYTFDTIDNI